MARAIIASSDKAPTPLHQPCQPGVFGGLLDAKSAQWHRMEQLHRPQARQAEIRGIPRVIGSYRQVTRVASGPPKALAEPLQGRLAEQVVHMRAPAAMHAGTYIDQSVILGEDLMRFTVGDEVTVHKWDPQRQGYPTYFLLDANKAAAPSPRN